MPRKLDRTCMKDVAGTNHQYTLQDLSCHGLHLEPTCCPSKLTGTTSTFPEQITLRPKEGQPGASPYSFQPKANSLRCNSQPLSFSPSRFFKVQLSATFSPSRFSQPSSASADFTRCNSQPHQAQADSTRCNSQPLLAPSRFYKVQLTSIWSLSGFYEVQHSAMWSPSRFY